MIRIRFSTRRLPKLFTSLPGSRSLAAFTAFVALAWIPFAESWAAEDPWYDDRIQLQLAPGGEIEEINYDYGTVLVDQLLPLFLLAIPDGVPQQQILGQMANDERIEWAEPAYRDETPETVREMVVIIFGGTVTDYLDQDVLERIRLDEILSHTTGAGVVVAVLDTGVLSGHPALEGSILENGYDFVDYDFDPSDTANGVDDDGDGAIDEGAGHGTMVAGIVHLVAPEARIMPVRVLDDEGRGNSFALTKGIVHAVHEGAQIINMSLGLPLHCNTIAWGVEYAAAAGVTLVAAAGNDDTDDPPYYPASDPAVLSVAALDSVDVKASFSSYHPTVSVSAPGAGILAPFHDGQYAIGAGTSFAAPFISGQAALVRSGLAVPNRIETESVMLAGVVDIDHLPGNAPYVGMLGSGRFDGLETWLVMSETSGAPTSAPLADWLVFPNPSSRGQAVTIRARKAGRAPRPASVHDLGGRLVARLLPEDARFGWDGRDLEGRKVPSGLYQIRFRSSRGWETVPLLRVP
jgi:subtilisin family serine protease